MNETHTEPFRVPKRESGGDSRKNNNIINMVTLPSIDKQIKTPDVHNMTTELAFHKGVALKIEGFEDYHIDSPGGKTTKKNEGEDSIMKNSGKVVAGPLGSPPKSVKDANLSTQLNTNNTTISGSKRGDITPISTSNK